MGKEKGYVPVGSVGALHDGTELGVAHARLLPGGAHRPVGWEGGRVGERFG